MKKKIRTSHSDLATCAYCGHREIGSLVLFEMHDNKLHCQNCYKVSHLEVHRSPNYTTKADCALNGDLPHRLEKKKYYLDCVTCGMRIWPCELPGNGRQRFTRKDILVLKGERK